MHQLLDAIDVALCHRPRRVVIDVRRIDAIGETPFRMTYEFGLKHSHRIGASLDRLAGVRGLGTVGAITHGFWQLLPPPCPLELFADLDEALRWLGVEDPSTIVERITGLYAELSGGSDAWLARLRLVLEARHDLSLAGTAKALGLSPRTLQRRLRRSRVRFKTERCEARVRAAQRRLLHSDDKLSAVALDLGFSSAQHFSNCFRRVTGVTPATWRAANACFARAAPGFARESAHTTRTRTLGKNLRRRSRSSKSPV
jgi:AraC-like DNA-binding protein